MKEYSPLLTSERSPARFPVPEVECSPPPEAEVLRIPPMGTPRGSVSDEGDATLVMGSGSKPPSEGRRSTSKKANRRFQLESSRISGDTYYARKSITQTSLKRSQRFGQIGAELDPLSKDLSRYEILTLSRLKFCE